MMKGFGDTAWNENRSLAQPSPATLSPAEAQALQVYLTRRFKL